MTGERPIEAVLIAGPTASGKSALALAIAQEIGGVIVNCDAQQIYAGLPILSAQPDEAERALVPHRLYGAIDPAERSSAGRYGRLAAAALADIRAEGKVAVIVGGTGLYFRALTDGLSPIPQIPESVRAELTARLAQTGLAAMRRELEARDPDWARRIAPTDRQRTLRGLEVVIATGVPLSEWQTRRGEPVVSGGRAEIVVMPERDWLRARIATRFEAMVAAGVLAEVQAFLARGLDPQLPAMKTLGLAELGAHLAGETSLTEAIAAAVVSTQRYAKRQATWVRNQNVSWEVIDPQQSESFVADIVAKICERA